MAEVPDPLEKKLAFYEVVILEKKNKRQQLEEEDKQNKRVLQKTIESFLLQKKDKKLIKDLDEKLSSTSKDNLELASKWCDAFKEERDNLHSYRSRLVQIVQRQLIDAKSLKDCCVIADNLRHCKAIPFTEDVAPRRESEWEVEKEGKKEPVVFVNPEVKGYEKWIEVAQGSYSVVYKSILFGSQVAIKVLKEKVEEEPLNKLKSEIPNLRNLSHPNLLRIYGAIHGNEVAELDKSNLPLANANFALITEYVPKRNLASLLFPPTNIPGAKVEHVVKFSIQRKADLLRQMVEAMAALHHHNVVHGNLRSANVLLDDDFNIKISDFGLSAVTKPNFDEVTQNSTTLYLAPENFDGSAPSKESDVFSFAMVAWELATERRLFDAYGIEIVIPKVNKLKLDDNQPREERKKIASQWREAVKEDKRPSTEDIKVAALAHLITSTWAKDPAARPSFETLAKEKPWDKIHHEVTALSEKFGKAFWESLKLAEGKNDVTWEVFIKQFASAFSLAPIFSNQLKYREAIKSAVEIEQFTPDKTQKNNETLRIVSKDKWDRFVKWFNLSNGPHLSAAVYSLLSQPYFFGQLTKDQAHKRLENQPEGTFLVRFDEGNWIVSYVDKPSEPAKDKTIEVVGSVEMSVSKLFQDKSVFRSRIIAKPCPVDRPERFVNIDTNAQQRAGSAYTYTTGSESRSAPPSIFEGELLTSQFQPGQTFVA